VYEVPASVAILIVGWQAGLAAVTHATVASSIGANTGASTSTSTGTGTAASPSSSAAAKAATPDAPAAAASGNFIGSSASTQNGSSWRVGVVDPADRTALLCAVEVDGSRHAVATSGSAERGDHILTVMAIDHSYLQATVVADDIETADVLATEIIAGGPTALSSVVERWSVDVLTVARDGSLAATPGFTTALARSR
jgi:hypothetical protein